MRARTLQRQPKFRHVGILGVVALAVVLAPATFAAAATAPTVSNTGSSDCGVVMPVALPSAATNTIHDGSRVREGRCCTSKAASAVGTTAAPTGLGGGFGGEFSDPRCCKTTIYDVGVASKTGNSGERSDPRKCPFQKKMNPFPNP